MPPTEMPQNKTAAHAKMIQKRQHIAREHLDGPGAGWNRTEAVAARVIPQQTEMRAECWEHIAPEPEVSAEGVGEHEQRQIGIALELKVQAHSGEVSVRHRRSRSNSR